MKTYTFEVTKKIVITVEAETHMAAVMAAEYDVSEGEEAEAFRRAEAAFDLVHVGVLA